MIKIEPTNIGRKADYAKLAKEMTKAIAAGALTAVEPVSGTASLAAASPSLIDATTALFNKKDSNVGQTAWLFLSSAFMLAIPKLIHELHKDGMLSKSPTEKEIVRISEELIERAREQVNGQNQFLTTEAFFAPLKVPFLRDATTSIPFKLRPFAVKYSVGDLRRSFESLILESFAEIAHTKVDIIQKLETALPSSFAQVTQRRRAFARHHNFIIEGFTQRAVFGQEDKGITLKDIYVRQRGLWNTKENIPSDEDGNAKRIDCSHNFFRHEIKRDPKYYFPLHVGDLHTTIASWLQNKNIHDSVRIISGGPGSGKSTFARAIAIEVIDSTDYDVLFVPLQDIAPTGSFEERISELYRNRTELGLDNEASPLDWLGKSQEEGGPPAKPLLIICDGLDEIAPPDSTEATNVTAKFIQDLKTWIGQRNSGGRYVRAIVLGRTVSAQAAFGSLGIAHQALIRVGGLMPLNHTREWQQANEMDCLQDKGKLSKKDQRANFWKNWCNANPDENSDLPVALQADNQAAQALNELTTEPLLLYLLIWTGYLGDKWHEAAENRNHVYYSIFKQIYDRKWGGNKENQLLNNKQQGGHTTNENMEFADFFILQQALGLASWATGGRTASEDEFNEILEFYLDEDQYEELKDNSFTKINSVALQGYTKSSGSDQEYEFVHKSIGEYLIALGLVGALEQTISILGGKLRTSRYKAAADHLSKIAYRGSLKSEIARFFEDEIKLRFESIKESRQFLNNSIIPVCNWAMENGFPVHQIAQFKSDKTNFQNIEVADRRVWDVFWSGLQTVAKQSYREQDFQKHDSEFAWDFAPVDIKWPTFDSFQALHDKLAASSHVSETRRLADFSFLDLTNQVCTDHTYGAVAYGQIDELPRLPDRWIEISMRATNLTGSFFLNSYLRSADMRSACLKRALLGDADLNSAILVSANLEGANLAGANLTGADLRGSNLRSADLRGANLQGADLRGATLNKANLEGADLRGANLDEVDLSGIDMSKTKR